MCYLSDASTASSLSSASRYSYAAHSGSSLFSTDNLLSTSTRAGPFFSRGVQTLVEGKWDDGLNQQMLLDEQNTIKQEEMDFDHFSQSIPCNSAFTGAHWGYLEDSMDVEEPVHSDCESHRAKPQELFQFPFGNDDPPAYTSVQTPPSAQGSWGYRSEAAKTIQLDRHKQRKERQRERSIFDVSDLQSSIASCEPIMTLSSAANANPSRKPKRMMGRMENGGYQKENGATIRVKTFILSPIIFD
ncbi:hypothetical protein BT69DRAFT_1347700 [Atractiella rhizophila]|nr:hypothetical protein BT69DRAFT_1347700 [Atractiella rhizophila]